MTLLNSAVLAALLSSDAGSHIIIPASIILLLMIAALLLMNRNYVLRRRHARQITDIASRYEDYRRRTECLVGDMTDIMKIFYDAASLSADDNALLLHKLKKMIHADSNLENNLVRHFIPMADTISFGLISALKDEYCELTTDDLEFCSLILLGFPAGTICYIYNMSNVNSLYNKSSRIRQKLGLKDNSGNLDSFLKERARDMKEKNTLRL